MGTGDIISQKTVEVLTKDDTIRTLVAKQYELGIPMLISAVKNSLNGKLKTFTRDDIPSKQWFAPTLLEYWKFRRIIRSDNS